MQKRTEVAVYFTDRGIEELGERRGEAAGLDVRDGVVTDASLRTSDPGIFSSAIATAARELPKDLRMKDGGSQ